MHPKPLPISPIDNEADEVQPETQLLNNIQYFPAGKHIWRQEGFYLVCRNCPLHHAVYIGADKMMVGNDDDNKPILINRSEYENYFKKKK